MRNIALRAAALVAFGSCLVGACSKKEETPPPAQPGQYPGYQQPGYPATGQPQQQPGYPAQQQPGHPPQQQSQPQQQPGYPAAPPAPDTTAPAGGAPTSQPSAIAFQCQSDVQCLTHRCNVQVGKCAWPCQSNDDCQPGSQCVAPACVPALPQQ